MGKETKKSALRRKKSATQRCAELTAKLLKAAGAAKLKSIELADEPLQRRVNFNRYIIHIRVILSQFKQTQGVLANYPELDHEIDDWVDKPCGTCYMLMLTLMLMIFLRSTWAWELLLLLGFRGTVQWLPLLTRRGMTNCSRQ